MGKILFITGTDTRVGKTVLTGLLLAHLRATGVRAWAMKPFCSGSRDDAKLFYELNNGEVSLNAVNPFYFPQPLAPLVAARLAGRKVPLPRVVDKIRALQKDCDALLVEGVGGLQVPLGEGYLVSDLIAGLRCSVILASWNKLGVINHVLLSAEALGNRLRPKGIAVVLNGQQEGDISVQSNAGVLREFLPRLPLFEVSALTGDLQQISVIRSHAIERQRVLAQIIEASSLRLADPKVT